jgi:Bacteriophage tail sheath protein
MPTYTVPGVFVEEISTFPPSIAEVATAVPAFLGYTETGALLKPTRIQTMKEYEQSFGGPPDIVTNVKVSKNDNGAITSIEAEAKPDRPLLYYSLQSYFDNGGGPCYVVSLGTHGDSVTLGDDNKGIKGGLAALQKEDEPTLILMPDATRLTDDFSAACGEVLNHCGTMKDRFAILDVKQDQKPDDFRKVSSDYLSYGAAYTPYLETALVYGYDESKVSVTVTGSETAFDGTFNGIKVTWQGASGKTPSVEILLGSSPGEIAFDTNQATLKLTITLNATANRAPSSIISGWNTWKTVPNNDDNGFDITADGDGAAVTPIAAVDLKPADPDASKLKLETFRIKDTAVYNQVKAFLLTQRVILPPSGAVAGIYARVDRDRGVWKAPANVTVTSVIKLTQTFTDVDLGLLNVDPTSGKSINVIRSFTGRGTFVWGARTLAGNDNEWRYIPVRRLFIMIEESAQKSTAFAVFEPNTAETWLKVRAMIESFLYGLWERGAMAGSKPDAAYFVHVGLGTTMTAQDILEGRMIVEIGIAAVRPAEFIILRFSHKMQEA